MRQAWGQSELNITRDKGREEDATWMLNVPRDRTDS